MATKFGLLELVSGAIDRGAHYGQGAMPVSSGVRDGAPQCPPGKGFPISQSESSAQLGVRSVRVDAPRSSAPLALTAALPIILDRLRSTVLAHLERLEDLHVRQFVPSLNDHWS